MHKRIAAYAAEVILYLEDGAYDPVHVAELKREILASDDPKSLIQRLVAGS